MKLSFWTFILGLVLGGVVTFLVTRRSAKTPFSILPYSANLVGPRSLEPGPSKRISFDYGMKTLHHQYDSLQPIGFKYYDPADPTNSTIRDLTLEGFSVDRKAIDSIMYDSTHLPDRLYIMFGVRIDTVATTPRLKIQQLFTTVLLGLKDTGTPGSYTYMTNNVFDYSNPCPPYCPN